MTSPDLFGKPHAVCIPFPAQGHINPMLKLAKLLHHKGFHITFVHTEFNHQRLLKSRGPDALRGLSSFRFETIPDGIPPSDIDATQDIPTLGDSTSKNCLGPFRDLLSKLNDSASFDVPPVTCVVSDGAMSFTLTAAEELRIPEVLFWTTSACGFMGYTQYPKLIERGLVPLKDAKCITSGYLDEVIDWIPGMKGIRLKDIPTLIRTANGHEMMLHYVIGEIERAQKAPAIILNTFDALEHGVLDALSSLFPPIYPIGPLHFLPSQLDDDSHLNITVMTADQLVEFSWGLANSNQTFLWIIRPDLVTGDSAVLPPEFRSATKERGLLASWCPQEQVLRHPSIGGFFTHNGWNSTLESICSGVPMVCWPFFAEQQTNCWYCCTQWGIGLEIDNDAKRDEVESLVTKLMVGEKGKEMKKKAMDWKRIAEEAPSFVNLENMINQVLLPPLITN
ncbi:hypothetical protein RJ640_006594 [Escallonia rubra]|uniref:Glycosyltransferase N-terminal domain-containing protein n=1 Tax=Escallonia rubra TaxID=112253 RepID=A0AA88QM77_9ASTE|nr:hypothetical protein RJ640_006594 [Escallonia rubra]